ncbi:hypothetical protein [Sphingobacterium sp.]|uniref:hypothetical protein n=1 Tax=Sphingobacterium sp. TaxID=341027 RepID=UPI0028A2C671|nr:hypothetical protein [Sphingobacterium sp.]
MLKFLSAIRQVINISCSVQFFKFIDRYRFHIFRSVLDETYTCLRFVAGIEEDQTLIDTDLIALPLYCVPEYDLPDGELSFFVVNEPATQWPPD